MKRIKTFLISLVLFFSLSLPSFAFVPLVIPAWVYGSAAALSVASAAAGLYYGMTPDVPSSVSALGAIGRSSVAAYAVLLGNVLTVKTDPITANLSAAKAGLLAFDHNKYPALYGAFYGAKIADMMSCVAGDYLDAGSYGKWQLGNLREISGASVAGAVVLPKLVTVGGGVAIYRATGEIYNYQPVFKVYTFDAVGTTAPSPVKLKTVPDSNASLTGSSAGGAVRPEYQAELDKMFQDPAYVPVFTDDTTGLPYLPPLVVLTPDQLTAENAKIKTAELTQAVIDARNGAITTATGAVTAIGGQLQDVRDKLLTAPADPVLLEKEKQLEIELEKAKTKEAELVTQVKTGELADAEDVSDTASPVPEKPPRKTISLEPFKNLLGLLGSTFPFNLPSSVASYFAAFSAGAAVAPVFDLPLPLDQSIHVDLGFFNPIAALIRYLVGTLITVGLLFYVFHFFRGIS